MKVENQLLTLSIILTTFGVIFLYAPFAQAQTVGPNLISNPSFSFSTTSPTNWSKGGYGSNTRTLTFPVSGYDDGYAVNVSITAYTSGDAKWYFKDVPIEGGHTYRFSDYSKSDIASIITIRYKLSNGSFLYKDIATLNSSATYQKATIEFITPQDAVSLTIFHLIKGVGTLTTDNYSLNEIIPPAPGGPPNLILNPGLEMSDVPGKPAYWNTGAWGNNTRAFTYPVTGASGSRAARVDITAYTSGDAKWYFTPLSISPGVYTYSDQYLSTVTSKLTVQYQYTNGTFSYKDLKILSPASVFTDVSVDLSVPADAKNVTVFHLIAEKGSLTVDNASLQLKAVPAGIFTTGAVSLTFDDGTISQYTNAVPKLNAAGLRGVFYIVSKRLSDYGYSGYMSIAQVKDVYNSGHEIGAHTRTHARLTALTTTQQQSEIEGSRQDLLALNVGPVRSFAYPYGDYNNAVVNVVKNAGFTNARNTSNSFVEMTSDPFELPRMGVEVNTTIAEIKGWIDTALANHEWLILGFHQIDTSGERYSTAPGVFNQIVDYLVLKNAPIVTVEEGIRDIP